MKEQMEVWGTKRKKSKNKTTTCNQYEQLCSMKLIIINIKLKKKSQTTVTTIFKYHFKKIEQN